MKIIHTGDVHLGSAFKNLTSAQAATRQRELLDGFRRLCAFAKEEGVSCVLIAGDLFDERTTSYALRQETAQIIEQAKPVCFFYASGNHDGAFALEEKPSNLYLFSEARGWKSYDLGENVTVTGADSDYFSPDLFYSLTLREERFNVLLLHGDITRGDGVTKENIPLSRLQNKHIDYLALGHIHIPTRELQRLDGRGKYRYCGCLEGRGFDECGDRGFFLLETQNGRLVGDRFYNVSKRRVLERRADISPCKSYADVENLAFAALSDVRREDVVKLVLCGRHAAGLRKDISLLDARLKERFFFAKVVDESRAEIDYAAFANDPTERGEFVRLIGRYEMSEEERAEILEVGWKALDGEEIDL